jgi:hypothetical protein
MPRRTWLIALALVAGLVSASLMVAATDGAFSAVTTNPGNTFQAAADFCPDVSVIADRDTSVAEDQPTVNDAGDAGITAASEAGANRRALVHFALPATLSSCTVTSVSLRLLNYEGNNPVGRTLRAQTITQDWAENTATWNNQPASTASGAASAPSGSAVTFDVTTQFATMSSGPNYGFSIVDSVEGGLGYTHTFASSEFPIFTFFCPTLIINYS